VLIWDADEKRRNHVCDFIEEAGARTRVLTDVAELAAVARSASRGLAVVAIGQEPVAVSPYLEPVRLLKRCGWRVLAYENEVGQWPVNVKCLPLLAGAVELLDSAESAFPRKLRRRALTELRLLAGQHLQEQEIRSALERLGVVGESPDMLAIFRQVVRFSALSDLPVLITGETGTGKELLARAIYQFDPKRAGQPFLALNCGAISPALAESELFGHRRGAFTGADRNRPGLIRSAAGGVVFLDEIGELEAALQAKLLRVLQEKSILSIGEEREVPVHARFIAATNRDVEQMVADGKFRADLLHRLRVLAIHIPPLRERKTDVPLLVRHFVHKHRAIRGAAPLAVSADFLEALRQLDLPGNARQVENLVRQALVSDTGSDELGLNDLPEEVLQQLTGRAEVRGSGAEVTVSTDDLAAPEMADMVRRVLESHGWNLSGAVRECERQMFAAAMQRTHGNQAQTARLLGITARSVYNKVRKHHLTLS
jgi:two-component system nitrogen regulation response regulator GlnG